MIRRTVKLQLVAFLLISALVIVYAGFNLIGINQQLFGNDYRVRVNLVQTGGIFAMAEVTYRGVSIGEVESLAADRGRRRRGAADQGRHQGAGRHRGRGREPLGGGPAVHRPAAAHRRGAVPEERHVITVENTRTPPHHERAADQPRQPRQLGEPGGPADRHRRARHGLRRHRPDAGPAHRLRQRAHHQADEALPVTVKLLNDSVPVLETQRVVRSDLKTYADKLAQFSAQLRASDGDLRALIDNGIGRHRRAGEPAHPPRADAAGAAEQPDHPRSGAGGAAAQHRGDPGALPDQRGGRLHRRPRGRHLALRARLDRGAPALQAGYESTIRRQGTDTAIRPANVFVDCAAPANSQPAIRGARSVPRPPGDTTGQFGGSSFPPGEGRPLPPNSQPSGGSQLLGAVLRGVDRAASAPASAPATASGATAW